MRPRTASVVVVRLTAVVVFALAAFAASCARPDDEAWLRFLGFRTAPTAPTTGTPIAVLEGDLRISTTDTADAEFRNGSAAADTTGGTGILVYRAVVDYSLPGFSPPSASLPLNLYIPPQTAAAARSPGTTGTETLSSFPLATAALKSWIIATGAFEDRARRPVVDLSARVTFFGVTDEGHELRTTGGIAISLHNGN